MDIDDSAVCSDELYFVGWHPPELLGTLNRPWYITVKELDLHPYFQIKPKFLYFYDEHKNLAR